MYIKESRVYDIYPDGMDCHSDGCGYWRGKNDHSNGDKPLLRMFKVNGMYQCEACLREYIILINEALE